MEPDIVVLARLLRQELDKHDLALPAGGYEDAVRAGEALDEEGVRRLALTLVWSRSGEKPGVNLLKDQDTVEVEVGEIARLLWALAESGRSVQGEDPTLTHMRWRALGEIAAVAAFLYEGDVPGSAPLPKAMLRRIASTLQWTAGEINRGIGTLSSHDPRFRELLTENLRTDASRATAMAQG